MYETYAEQLESGYGSDEDFSEDISVLDYEDYCKIYEDDIKEVCYTRYPDMFNTNIMTGDEEIIFEDISDEMYDKYLESKF